MSVVTILDAIEQYLKTRKELQTPETDPCNEWDCGLANEFSGYYSSQHRDSLETAKATLQRALDDYIDRRVRTILNGGK